MSIPLFYGGITGTITITDNENTNENNCIIFAADADQDGGNIALESDSDLTYNPSTGKITATGFIGDLTGKVFLSTDASTNTNGALRYYNNDFWGYKAGTWTSLTSGSGGTPTDITVAATTDTSCSVGLWTDATGDLGPKTDPGLTYNATSNILTATGGFAGDLTGDITGNVSGTAATVTGAAQTAITSLGTLTALTVDDIAINGKVITMTGDTNDTAVFTAGTNGTLSIVTTDTADADANITITADGTAELAGTTVTLNSGGGITLDADNGTITFADGGSSLGTITSSGYTGNVVGNVSGSSGSCTGNSVTATTATTVTITDNESTNENNCIVFAAGADQDGGNLGLESDGTLTYNPSTGKITATGFIGDLTGDVSGTAATVTGAAQTAITSLGTLTALTVDDIAINGKVLTMTGDTDDTAVFTAGTNGTLSIVTTDTAAAAANITITADGTAELAGTTVTLNSGGGITLDADNGTITFADGGSSLGTITSSGYTGNVVGDVTGNVSGTAATVTGAAQTAITSVGTLTGLTISGNLDMGDGEITNCSKIAVNDGDTIRFNGASGDAYIYNTSGTDQITFVSGGDARIKLQDDRIFIAGPVVWTGVDSWTWHTGVDNTLWLYHRNGGWSYTGSGSYDVGYIVSSTAPTGTQMNFTGQHRCQPLNKTIDYSTKVGYIVKSTGNYCHLLDKANIENNKLEYKDFDINDALPIIDLVNAEKDKSVFGVISNDEDDKRVWDHGAWGTTYHKITGDKRLFINSLGEGSIWVSDINGYLENGDYICSSSIPGLGMKQDDDLLHNYTVAKITMDCDFNPSIRSKRKVILQENSEGELDAVVDSNGYFQWEDIEDENEYSYEIKYIRLNGTIITKEVYDQEKAVDSNAQVYKMAFVGCTYHCG